MKRYPLKQGKPISAPPFNSRDDVIPEMILSEVAGRISG